MPVHHEVSTQSGENAAQRNPSAPVLDYSPPDAEDPGPGSAWIDVLILLLIPGIALVSFGLATELRPNPPRPPRMTTDLRVPATVIGALIMLAVLSRRSRRLKPYSATIGMGVSIAVLILGVIVLALMI